MIRLSCNSHLVLLCALLLMNAGVSADIYRVVDENGNVTYTDQPPQDGAKPMDLPELSVIQTEQPPEPPPAARDEENSGALSSRELRKLYRDFAITQPQNEETFWGTANTVVVGWGGSAPVQPGMTVSLYVDGVAQDVTGTNSISLTLDRGTHTVRVELFNGGKRPLVSSPTVTFFVKQASIGLRSKPAIPIGG